MVFTVLACGFTPRCALEEIDSGTVRLTKVQKLIGASRFGIHELSRVELTTANNLPRFNMPFELGLDIGAKTFGGYSLRQKRFLILDSVPYRYQQFISDISGQDIRCHDGSTDRAIGIVRDWLRCAARRAVPGSVAIKQQFEQFVTWLPDTCAKNGIDRNDLLFVDYVEMVRQWLARSTHAAA